jgi:hypothetical protein
VPANEAPAGILKSIVVGGAGLGPNPLLPIATWQSIVPPAAVGSKPVSLTEISQSTLCPRARPDLPRN